MNENAHDQAGAGTEHDIIAVQRREHARLDDLCRLVERATTADERERAARALVTESTLHSGAEELAFYPAVRSMVADGRALAMREIAQHDLARELYARLQRMHGDNPAFEACARAAVAALRAHIADEEAHVLARVQELPPRERDALGAALMRARMRVPMRSHPHMPTMPPFNAMLAPVVRMLDHAMPVVRMRGRGMMQARKIAPLLWAALGFAAAVLVMPRPRR